jgi:hypothetical protein
VERGNPAFEDEVKPIASRTEQSCLAFRTKSIRRNRRATIILVRKYVQCRGEWLA